MALLDLDALANNEDFRKRVKVAMVNAAQNVSSEANDPLHMPYHTKRSTHAHNILSGPENYVDSYAYGCAAPGVLNEASTDSDIQFTVNAIFDAQAGVMLSDKPTEPDPEPIP